MAAKKLPHQSLYLVPRHGITHFAADGDPEPAFPAFIFFKDNDEVGSVNLPAGARQLQELRSFSKAGRFRKRFRGLGRHPSALKCAPAWAGRLQSAVSAP